MLDLEADEERTLEQLRQIPVPKTRAWNHRQGGTWSPVQHGKLAALVLREARAAGLRPTASVWSAAL